jgi:predicted lipoprotein with Yx(FWY)xxD motif
MQPLSIERTPMARRAWRLASLVAVSAIFVACAGPGASTAPTNQAIATSGVPTTGPTTAAAGLTLEVKTSTFGDYVAGKDGMSLYVFEKDTKAGESACYGDCAGSWPALTVAAATDVTAGAGVTGELGTITRTDGALQVTIDGHPVYYFSGDSKAGDVNGQEKFDVWYLVSPAGEAVGEDGGATTAPGGTQCSGPTCY